MVVKILLFGQAAESAGARVIDLELSGEANTDRLIEKLGEKFPELVASIPFSIAVNRKYIKGNQVLSFEDEIALIPPVSGG
ncbi:MAG: MoaD/ThiS family protein [Flavobacteriales bacterium]